MKKKRRRKKGAGEKKEISADCGEPVIVGLEDEGGGGDVEHDFPGDEGFPGELDHRLVGHVRQQVPVELAVPLQERQGEETEDEEEEEGKEAGFEKRKSGCTHRFFLSQVAARTRKMLGQIFRDILHFDDFT